MRIEISHAAAFQFARADVKSRAGIDPAAVKFALKIFDDDLRGAPMTGESQVTETEFGAVHVACLHLPIQSPGSNSVPWSPLGFGRRQVRGARGAAVEEQFRAEPHRGVRGSVARSFPAAISGMKFEEASVALPFQEKWPAPNQLLPAASKVALNWVASKRMAVSRLEFASREKVVRQEILRPWAQGVSRAAADHFTCRNGSLPESTNRAQAASMTRFVTSPHGVCAAGAMKFNSAWKLFMSRPSAPASICNTGVPMKSIFCKVRATF